MSYKRQRLKGNGARTRIYPLLEDGEPSPLTDKRINEKISLHRAGKVKYVRPSTSRPIAEVDTDFYGGYILDPDGPTDYPPGSEGKIRVMADRFRRRVRMHHPGDFHADTT